MAKRPILFSTPAPQPVFGDVWLGTLSLTLASGPGDLAMLAPFATACAPTATSVQLLGERQPRFTHILIGVSS